MILVDISHLLFQTQRPSKTVSGSPRPLVHLGAKPFLLVSQPPTTIAGSRGFSNILVKSQNIMDDTGAKDPSDRLEQFLKVAISAAEMAGDVIAEAWNKTKVVEHKGRSGCCHGLFFLLSGYTTTHQRPNPKDETFQTLFLQPNQGLSI